MKLHSQARTVKVLLVFLLVIAQTSLSSGHEQYDVVLLGGRVMDPESGYDAVANVGIRADTIAAITQNPISGETEIDAAGLVVAPGFIDTHNHWPRPIGYKLALRDGVTTSMDLELGTYGPRVGDWYEMHDGRAQANYGTASSHEFARSLVLDGYSDALDAPSSITGVRRGTRWALGELNGETAIELLQTIDKGLRHGAIGNSSTLGYWPGASAREMYEVQRLAALYGRLTAVHTRYTPGNATTESNGAQEILANAAALGSSALISHFNNPGWELVQELLVSMRSNGHNVWAEYYPYAAGSTTINANFLRPETWEAELGKDYLDTLQDPTTGNFLSRERYEAMRDDDPTKLIVVYKSKPEDIPRWIALEGITCASDAIPAVSGDWNQLPWDTPYDALPNAHPRTAGTYAKSLRVARENEIPLMHVLATFSYNTAKYLGNTGLEAMQSRGRLQVGMVADITLFDPDTVSETASYANGLSPSKGIPYVLVSGVPVVEESRVQKGVFPGRPIRFPVEPEGRFNPSEFKTRTVDYFAR